MKKVMSLFIALAAIFLIAASNTSSIKRFTGSDNATRYLLNEVDVGASAALRTVTENVAGYTKLIMYVFVDDSNDSVTAYGITCYGSLDGTSYGRVTSRSVSSGSGTLYPYTDNYPVSGSGNKAIDVVYDVWAYSKYKCLYGTTGGDSNTDKIYVQWQAAVDK